MRGNIQEFSMYNVVRVLSPSSIVVPNILLDTLFSTLPILMVENGLCVKLRLQYRVQSKSVSLWTYWGCYIVHGEMNAVSLTESTEFLGSVYKIPSKKEDMVCQESRS